MQLFANWKKRSQRRELYDAYVALIGRSDRVALLNAEELAILLDELKVWEHYDLIPNESIYIPATKDGLFTISSLLKINNLNKIHLKATRGVPLEKRVIGLKCKRTGRIQETSAKQ